MKKTAVAGGPEIEGDIPFWEEPLNNSNAEIYEFPQGKSIEYTDSEKSIVFTSTWKFWEAKVFDKKTGKVVGENTTVVKVQLLYQVLGDSVYFLFNGVTLIGDDLWIKKVVSKEEFKKLFWIDTIDKKAQNSASLRGNPFTIIRWGIGDLVSKLTK